VGEALRQLPGHEAFGQKQTYGGVYMWCASSPGSSHQRVSGQAGRVIQVRFARGELQDEVEGPRVAHSRGSILPQDEVADVDEIRDGVSVWQARQDSQAEGVP
jgi:hypothetical protein